MHLDCARWTELIRKRAPAELGNSSGRCAAEAERFRTAEPPGMAEENVARMGGERMGKLMKRCEFWMLRSTDGETRVPV